MNTALPLPTASPAKTTMSAVVPGAVVAGFTPVFSENPGTIRGKKADAPMAACQAVEGYIWVAIPISAEFRASKSGKTITLGELDFADANILCNGQRVYVDARIGVHIGGATA